MDVAKPKCGHLFGKFSDRARVDNFLNFVDDAVCIMLKHFAFKHNGGFYKSDVSTTQLVITFATNAKFEDKILAWITMSPKSFNHPFIRNSGFAVNGQCH